MQHTTQSAPDFQPIWGIQPKDISTRVNLDVLEQHLDEAAFLWPQHQQLVLRPDVQLDDILDEDEYLQANLDGLLLGEDKAWSLCEALLNSDSDEIFVPAYIAFMSNRANWIYTVLDAVNEENEASFIGALSWIEYVQAEPFIHMLLQHEKAYFNYLGIGACIAHRCIPIGTDVDKYINSDVVILKHSAIRLIGSLKLQQYRQHLQPYLSDIEESNRFEAARALALIGERSHVIPVLTRFAENSALYQVDALQILLRIIDEPTQRKLINGFILSGNLKAAIRSIGIVGYTDFIPWLISMMEQPDLSRIAGESFSFITGTDIDYSDLIIEELDEDEPEDDLEDDSDDDSEWKDDEDTEDELEDELDEYEEDLPVPDPVLVKAWWDQYGSGYQPNIRYLAGTSINDTNLLQVYKTGFQRQRIYAALELTLLEPENFWFNSSIPAYWQLSTMLSMPWK